MAVEAYITDTQRPIKFQYDSDLTSQTLLAYVYDLNGTEYPINTSGVTSTGSAVGTDNIVMCDFSSVPSGVYSLVVRTADLVVATDHIVIFNKDGYSIG